MKWINLQRGDIHYRENKSGSAPFDKPVLQARYYCTPVTDPMRKLLVYYERELTPAAK